MNKVNTMIKVLRTEKGMNQEQLAEKLQVTRQAVSNWETGKTQPDIETLTRMAEVFGVSVEKLVDLEVREQIGRFKYIHDTDLKEAYNKVVEQLVSELAGLTAKEDR